MAQTKQILLVLEARFGSLEIFDIFDAFDINITDIALLRNLHQTIHRT